MTFRPTPVVAPTVVRSLGVGAALLSVTTFVLATAAGWPAGRAGTLAVAVPLAASTGAAVVLGLAFLGSAVHYTERVARGRFALPVTAAAAGCVLASLWLVAPNGVPPLRTQDPPPAGQARAAAPPVVVEVPPPAAPAAPPAGRGRDTLTPGTATDRAPGAINTGSGRGDGSAGPIVGPPAGPDGAPGVPSGPLPGPPAGPDGAPGVPTGPLVGPPTPPAGPAAGPVGPPAPPPVDEAPRARPGAGIDRAGVDQTPAVDTPTDERARRSPKAAKAPKAPGAAPKATNARRHRLAPGKRCGQRTDHCAVPFAHGRARRSR